MLQALLSQQTALQDFIVLVRARLDSLANDEFPGNSHRAKVLAVSGRAFRA
jgi:hypothetical protein